MNISDGKIQFTHVVHPTLGGHRVSGIPTKYAATGLTATSDIPGLILCGRDVSTSGIGGDIQVRSSLNFFNTVHEYNIVSFYYFIFLFFCFFIFM